LKSRLPLAQYSLKPGDGRGGKVKWEMSVYMNPRYILGMFELLQKKEWDELAKRCEVLCRHDDEGLAPFAARGFTDTAYDHLQGLVAGFLEMSPVSQGPYLSCTDEDVKELRAWMSKNVPELLEL